jgi:hypothetical protein
MESNHPTGGLLRPAGFEDRMGHQTPAAPPGTLSARGQPAAAGVADLTPSNKPPKRVVEIRYVR